MTSTKTELIAHLTANNRSRHGYFEILKQALVGNTLWLLLKQPDGATTLAWEQLSETDGRWSAESFSGTLPTTYQSAEAAFDAASCASPAIMAWKGFVERVQGTREKLRKFRRNLAPNDILKVNGYAFTLVRRLIDSNGWIVKRDGTEMRLTGATFETAVKQACPA